MPSFFEQPILNSPYHYPGQHWELDSSGQPTGELVKSRRPAEFITPIPKPKRVRKNQLVQQTLELFDTPGISDDNQKYDLSLYINSLREKVSAWRQLPNAKDWRVSPVTQKLLHHWRTHEFQGIRPFFCQLEAVETAIWLAEVAPQSAKFEPFLKHLEDARESANPNLFRVALKLATGAGKTTVMAMLIAWQVVNAVRSPSSKRFTRGFLIVTPGITIRDRLRVLQPNDPDSYYKTRDLLPPDLIGEIGKANIVITNYHAFQLRDKFEGESGTRKLIEGRGEHIVTAETEGEMLRRVMPSLMGMKNIVVINDEAHHCYRENPDNQEDTLQEDDRKEAKENSKAARCWINGLETVQRKLGVSTVYDLSATPFFLRGSGYAEGTLFPWVASDFSLMDAIECGIVKLPRVPIADNVPSAEIPMYRELWKHIGKRMPKQGRSKNTQALDPGKIPKELEGALDALYGHYKGTFEQWEQDGLEAPPVFIVVCNNTSSSKLVYDYIAGYTLDHSDGSSTFQAGKLELFRNYDEHGNRYPRPRTLLIDSHQLESGESLDKDFRQLAADEIEQFRREIAQREGSAALSKVTDEDLLREVMNTVGKPGKLGSSIRCVVSVSMLTEGWDCNTVTHILGVRAFGTQLLCEQVIGRALRRYSYELNEEDRFNVEYADVFGIPFDFTAKPMIAPVKTPKKTTHICAVSPDRDHLAITFPRVTGYRVELPEDQIRAKFSEDSVLHLTPETVAATKTNNQGIVGEGVELDMSHLKDTRQSTIAFHLTGHLINSQFRDPGEPPKIHLFGKIKRVVKQWLKDYLQCSGGVEMVQVLYVQIADQACERIKKAITDAEIEAGDQEQMIKAVIEPFNPTGSTHLVNFNTSKINLWRTAPHLSHVNYVVCDSDWEAEFCRVVEGHPRVKAYVKNQGLGFEVPYLYFSTPRQYIPDFIVLVDDGHGPDDLLHLIVEIKGYRSEDAKDKSSTMETYWVPGVNNLKKFGRWAFAEFGSVFEIEQDLAATIARYLDAAIAQHLN